MNTKDIDLDTRFFCLFKGDPGSGKSIAAASYPKPYFFDIDRRLKSVVNYWRARGKEFEYDPYDSPLDINRRLEEFIPYCPFETLILDSVTTWTRAIFKTAKNMRASNAKRIMHAGVEQAQIEDYGAELNWWNTIIGNLKTISFKHNVNVIVTAHVLTSESIDLKSQVTKVSRKIVTAGKQTAAQIPVDFDEAYHFDVQSSVEVGGQPSYTIVTRNVGWDWAKTALPISTRVDFTNGSLYDIIMEQLSKSQFVHAVNNPGSEVELKELLEQREKNKGDW